MVLDAFFRRASETFPIPVMLRALLERVFEPARLNDWFEAVTEKQYTRELLFSSAFELMSVVVFKAFGSVHAAYQAKRTAGEITVSVTSVYNKLNGVEAQTSRALVRDTAGHLRHLVEDVQGGCRPWLPGYRVKVLDGNCIAATEHRLQVLRTTAAGPLPGKALVVYDPAVEMAIDVFPCEDGHAQERALLGEVVPTVQAGDLWIMDRNFCVRAFLAGIEARAGTFLCRYHKGLPVTALAPARFVGSIETGKVYEQQVEVLMAPRPGEDADDVRIYRLVRVELTRATRGGDKTLLLLTDLSKSAATGKQVAELYRRRWTIETMFQQLEAHLHSEVNTLGYPAAALFAFCVALVAYNVLAVVKGALRGLHGEQTIHDTVSGYYIAGEIGRTYEALLGFVPADQWTQVQALSHEAFLTLLMGLARAVDLAKYRKHPRGPKKPKGAALLRWRPNQSLRRRRGRRQLDPSRRGEERRRGRWPTVLLSSATDGGLPLVLARFVRGLSTHQGSGCLRRLRTAATAAKCHRAPVDSHRVADQMPTGPSTSRRRAPHAASPLPRG